MRNTKVMPVLCSRQVLAVSIACFAAASLAVPRPVSAYEAITVTDGGTIEGVVTLNGEAPALAPIKTTKNQDYCGATIANPVYAIGKDHGVGNVEVYLKDISKGKAKSTEPVQLVNEHCMFAPRVQGASVGQQLKISSNDPVLHNTHPQVAATNATLYNIALPFKGFSVTKPLPPAPELIKVKCDAHEWMHGWIWEFDHPYFATTDKDGHFAIHDVPPGTYTLVAWHEVMPEKTASVTVTAGKAVKADIQLTAK